MRMATQLLRCCLVLLLAGIAASGVPALAGGKIGPVVPQGQGESCVEPVDVMRRNHMEFILHQRDETVHRGIRTSKYSLNECISCHVVPDSAGDMPAAGEAGHFCSSCHVYAAVQIDCFQCHADQPMSVGHGGRPARTAHVGDTHESVATQEGQ